MLPIIVALSSHDSNLVKSTLTVAQDIVPNAQDLVVQHLGSFIHALLRLTRFQSANVRIVALECLASIALKGKPNVLRPFKPSVVKELSTALDDKKRLVRRNAVDCREKWYVIDCNTKLIIPRFAHSLLLLMLGMPLGSKMRGSQGAC